MLELLQVAIALIGSFIAGFWDLKTSNIPDKLCIFMIISGLAIHSYVGLTTGDYGNLINSLLFGGLFLAFGIIMYFTGQWGGGDGELLVAIGVLVPNLTIAKTFFPFALSFFINSFFIGAAFAVLYSVVLAMKSPLIRRNFAKSVKTPSFLLALAPFVALSMISFFYFKALSAIFLLSCVLIVFWKFAKSIDKGFVKRIPVGDLKVDDMLAEDIPSLKIRKNLIKGLTKEQVAKIKKIKRYVLVREGIRYGLVFPLTLVFTLLFGDFFFLLL
jgi:Flp pilus assembly protein protease CpaA